MPASKRAWQSIRWRVEYGTALGICKNGFGQYSHEQRPVVPDYAGHYHWCIIGDSDHVGGQWSQDGDGAVAGGQIYIYVNSNLEEVPVITEADREAIRMLDGVKGCTSTAGNMLNSVTTGKNSSNNKISFIAYACDAGMGSSAMGASLLKKKLAKMGIDIKVEHFAIEKVPENVDLIVTHKNLYDRAKMVSGNKEIITIENYLKDTNIDMLIERIKQENNK